MLRGITELSVQKTTCVLLGGSKEQGDRNQDWND